MTLIAPTLQAFFSDRLVKQLHASPRTIASYRDTLSLLLRFVQVTTGKAPSALEWDQLDEPVIAAFLEHLETVLGDVEQAGGTAGKWHLDAGAAEVDERDQRQGVWNPKLRWLMRRIRLLRPSRRPCGQRPRVTTNSTADPLFDQPRTVLRELSRFDA